MRALPDRGGVVEREVKEREMGQGVVEGEEVEQVFELETCKVRCHYITSRELETCKVRCPILAGQYTYTAYSRRVHTHTHKYAHIYT